MIYTEQEVLDQIRSCETALLGVVAQVGMDDA